MNGIKGAAFAGKGRAEDTFKEKTWVRATLLLETLHGQADKSSSPDVSALFVPWQRHLRI